MEQSGGSTDREGIRFLMAAARDDEEAAQRLIASGITLADGRYRLTCLLGYGGMAAVFGAVDTLLQEPRAIKIAYPGTRGRRSRIGREATAIGRIRHPFVATLYDSVSTDDLDYLVLEWVRGTTVRDLVASGRLSSDDAIRMVSQLLAALSAVHAAGVVHRDVKASNVMRTESGDTKLLDFGIALLSGEDTRLTQAGAVLGTLSYMAPEQRDDARAVTPTADLYAVGSLLYAALGGGSPLDLWAESRHSRRWNAIPAQYVPLVRRAVQRRPEDRFQSASAMLEAVLDLSHGIQDEAARLRAVTIPPSDCPPVPEVPIVAMVDDDPTMGDIVRALLEDLAVDLVHYRTGAHLLAANSHPSLVLLDLHMPGFDGFATLKRIRRHPTLLHVPVLVLTSSRVVHDVERAFSMGADDFVNKPFRPRPLRARIRRWLRSTGALALDTADPPSSPRPAPKRLA